MELVSAGDGGSITVTISADADDQLLAVSTPNGLPGIPVTSGGNYTDADGQRWVCDEADFARGVYVQRIGKLVIEGTNGGNWEIHPNGIYIANIFADAVQTSSYNVPCLSNLREWKNTYSWTVDGFGVEYGIFWFYDADRQYGTNVTQYKEYFAANPMTVLYPLAEPIETPLTAEELTAYAALRTNKLNTTILNDAGAHMEVSYIADTKVYIDN